MFKANETCWKDYFLAMFEIFWCISDLKSHMQSICEMTERYVNMHIDRSMRTLTAVNMQNDWTLRQCAHWPANSHIDYSQCAKWLKFTSMCTLTGQFGYWPVSPSFRTLTSQFANWLISHIDGNIYTYLMSADVLYLLTRYFSILHHCRIYIGFFLP